MEAPSFYQQESAIITKAVERLAQIHEELSQAYERWAELES
jgi:ATP-binding cassette subfamily F protein uup